MNTNLDKLSSVDLRRAADIRDEIDGLTVELAQLLSGKKKPGRKPAREMTDSAPIEQKAKKTVKKKAGRKRTEAQRQAQSEKMKASWAKRKRKQKKAAKQ